MIRTCCALLLSACCIQVVFGQSDYRRRELGGGASIVGADTKGAFNRDKSRDALYGFEAFGSYNVSRFWGLKADVSYAQRTFEVNFNDVRARLTQVTGGIKFQDNKTTTRFRPFAHALAGVAHASNLARIVRIDSIEVLSIRTGTGAAFVLGGGLDVRLTRSLDLRPFQIDYNPSWIKGDAFQNLRLGAGLNFRF